jgi:hypothetical protein
MMAAAEPDLARFSSNTGWMRGKNGHRGENREKPEAYKPLILLDYACIC